MCRENTEGFLGVCGRRQQTQGSLLPLRRWGFLRMNRRVTDSKRDDPSWGEANVLSRCSNPRVKV